MPIDQTRMESLIRAAQEYQDLFEKLGQGAEGLLASQGSGEISLEQHAEMLFDLKQALRPSPDSVKAITAEAVHFKLTARRNELNKARQRRRRAGFAMGEGNRLSIENAAVLAEGEKISSPRSIVPQRAGAEPSMRTKPAVMETLQRYAPPTKAELEQASHASFIAESERVRKSLRDGTFLKPSDPSIEEVETIPDPEAYDAESPSDAEDF